MSNVCAECVISVPTLRVLRKGGTVEPSTIFRVKTGDPQSKSFVPQPCAQVFVILVKVVDPSTLSTPI